MSSHNETFFFKITYYTVITMVAKVHFLFFNISLKIDKIETRKKQNIFLIEQNIIFPTQYNTVQKP